MRTLRNRIADAFASVLFILAALALIVIVLLTLYG